MTCNLIQLYESLLNDISISNDGTLNLTSGNDNQIFIYSIINNATNSPQITKNPKCFKEKRNKYMKYREIKGKKSYIVDSFE